MKFYTTQHPYYCGIDLHARSLYVCILNADGETIVHREIKVLPEPLLDLLAPYIGNIVVSVGCMHCWYWVSVFCAKHGIDFILGSQSALIRQLVAAHLPSARWFASVLSLKL